MNVLTINQTELTNLSLDLLAKIDASELSKIDMIIGIATGGIYVSRPIHKELQKKEWSGKYYEVKLSRLSTGNKKKLNLSKLLQKLPYLLLDPLRKFEVKIFETFKSESYDSSREQQVIFSPDMIKDIQLSQSVLLIDDAIDTGSTILAMKNVIHRINPKIDVNTAVLTVTHKTPYIEPSFYLYQRVLLRCPWSLDYKEGDRIE